MGSQIGKTPAVPLKEVTADNHLPTHWLISFESLLLAQSTVDVGNNLFSSALQIPVCIRKYLAFLITAILHLRLVTQVILTLFCVVLLLPGITV